MKFKITLTERGKQIFKGGNIEVMKPNLITFEALNLKKAQEFFYNKFLMNIGTSQEYFYKIEEIK